jgi:hypothetical protein
LSVESQAVKRILGGWYEMAASLGVCQLEHAVGGEPPFREDLFPEAEE